MKILNKLYAKLMMSLPLVSLIFSYLIVNLYFKLNVFFVIAIAIILWFTLHSLGLLFVMILKGKKGRH